MNNARNYLLDLLGPAGDEDDLIGQVEDARAHVEAEKLRAEAKEYEKEAKGLFNEGAYYKAAAVMAYAASLIDPYEMRDGQLVRKSDGKPVTP